MIKNIEVWDFHESREDRNFTICVSRFLRYFIIEFI